jgi:hypothetical protein
LAEGSPVTDVPQFVFLLKLGKTKTWGECGWRTRECKRGAQHETSRMLERKIRNYVIMGECLFMLGFRRLVEKRIMRFESRSHPSSSSAPYHPPCRLSRPSLYTSLRYAVDHFPRFPRHSRNRCLCPGASNQHPVSFPRYYVALLSLTSTLSA